METNPIPELAASARSRFPDADVHVDKPLRDAGIWFLDIRNDARTIHVEWKLGRPVLITSRGDIGYGEGGDETFTTLLEAWDRIVALVLSGAETQPPPPRTLAQLRRELGFTQNQIAEMQGSTQASISKAENRSDMLVSTLDEMVRAIGGRLELHVHLADGRARRVVLKEAK